MKKLMLILCGFFFVNMIFAQEICTSEEEDSELNEVSNISKCSVVGNAVPKNGTLKNSSKVIVVSNRNRQKRRSLISQRAISLSELEKADIVSFDTLNKLHALELFDVKKSVLAVNAVILNKKSNITIPFNDVEQIPQFKECVSSTNDVVNCFNSQMESHLISNIVYPKKALHQKVEGDVWVSFIITKQGTIEDIKTKGPDLSELLQEEAVRVIKLLPEFVPGSHNNVTANVSFSFPINFNLQDFTED
ncbi:energy transducer TonB [Tenacibaculum sp. SG-28]|uniref:energy transducer TonB n=1 Tax=Tenacibaculum sp. SG-28 TaxID=754426 RepID=UPI000CF41EF2|nr:energy transducer TonB [Tenacibaculum sp. SG-28]PQJ21695.1 hypothetical protein BSU00_06325 [Tenacibaculum sp. SG-28]